jgi:signal transduction histidine kinase
MDTNETKIFYTLILGLTILSLLIAVFLFEIISFRKKKNALRTNNLKEYFDLHETEKQRIGLDLHDDLGASLSGVKILLKCIEVSGEEDAAIVVKCENSIDGLMAKVRHIAYNMTPFVLQNKGLDAALEELVESMTSAAGINAVYYNAAVIYNKETSIYIYRIVQEAVNNMVKHSKATEFQLHLHRQGRKIIVFMEDNGIGFDSKNTGHTGLGLRNISARAELLKADIYLKTEPGKGVEMLIEIPDNEPKYKNNNC